jgi:hypothetical protein
MNKRVKPFGSFSCNSMVLAPRRDCGSDYCGCFAVLINERVTNAEWLSNLKAGRWEKNPKLIVTTKYCRDTYKGLPM